MPLCASKQKVFSMSKRVKKNKFEIVFGLLYFFSSKIKVTSILMKGGMKLLKMQIMSIQSIKKAHHLD
jgi:tmRNA-binding protein